MKTSNKSINRGAWSLRCSRANCPSETFKPCWLNGQFGKGRDAGVDVVGYLLSEIGLGEASRLMVQALDSVGIPTGLVNVSLDKRMNETAMKERIAGSDRHNVALSVMGMLELSSFARRSCRGQMNIAYPFWELPTFPFKWKRVFEGFDAYWAPSTFIRDMLLENQDRPVHLIPQPVLLQDAPPQRQTFSGPLKFYSFFDFDSFMNRKNPLGAINAFRSAFPLGTEDVKLVIKARGNPSDKDRKALYSLAQSDPRIQIREELLSRSEMLALMEESNVFLSLHRSEGFGLGCAEALAQGKIVVATDFGGTKDFISSESGYPVSFKQVGLSPEDYPASEGSYWAEPNNEHATSILQEIYTDPINASAKSLKGFEVLQQNHSLRAVGEAIKRCLR